MGEIVNRFDQGRVLVIGDVMLDHFIWGRVSRISPEAPVPVVEVWKDERLLGGCANVMNNIRAMGGTVFGAGVIGDDGAGKRLREILVDRGIDPAGMVVEAGRPTTLKTRVIAHHQQVVRFDREHRQPICKESTAQVLAFVAAHRQNLGAIVISDYGKGVVSPELLVGIRRLAAEGGIPVCLDPKHSDFSLYHGMDVVTPNHHEACRALGLDVTNGEDIVSIGETLVTRYDFRALLITRGEKGISLFERKRGGVAHTLFPAAAREVFDVTGAGDTVIGVFALAVAVGAGFREATILANCAAGIVVGKVGTATASREELANAL